MCVRAFKNVVHLFTGAAILLRGSSLLSVYSQISEKMKTKRRECLREMPQEGWEIFDLRLGSLAFEDSGTHHEHSDTLHLTQRHQVQ